MESIYKAPDRADKHLDYIEEQINLCEMKNKLEKGKGLSLYAKKGSVLTKREPASVKFMSPHKITKSVKKTTRGASKISLKEFELQLKAENIKFTDMKLPDNMEIEPIVDFSEGQFADAQLMQELESVFMTSCSKSTKETATEQSAAEHFYDDMMVKQDNDFQAMKIAFEDNESIGDVSVYADISISSRVWCEGEGRDERLA